MAITLDPARSNHHSSFINDTRVVEGLSDKAFSSGMLVPFSLKTFHKPSEISPSVRSRPHSLWQESILTIQKYVDYGRRKVKSDERIYFNGDHLKKVYLIYSGLFKIVNVTPDGREQPAGLLFKGDWLGFDGIPSGRYSCSAISLDAGELWSIDYENLLHLSAKEPALLRLMMSAISAQLAQNRDVMLSMSKLPANSRVCDFLLQWAYCLEDRGLRTDQFNVYLTRADIGRYLGLRLESVSRALSKLSKQGLIEFNERGRREISIPHLGALADFIQNDTDRYGQFLQ